MPPWVVIRVMVVFLTLMVLVLASWTILLIPRGALMKQPLEVTTLATRATFVPVSVLLVILSRWLLERNLLIGVLVALGPYRFMSCTLALRQCRALLSIMLPTRRRAPRPLVTLSKTMVLGVTLLTSSRAAVVVPISFTLFIAVVIPTMLELKELIALDMTLRSFPVARAIRASDPVTSVILLLNVLTTVIAPTFTCKPSL